jgi:nucleoid-associated protein YgaU
MAAIVRPHQIPTSGPARSPRPALRLVEGGRTAVARPAVAPALQPWMVVVAAVVAIVLAVAIGRGAFAALAPAPPSARPAAAAAGSPTVVVQAGDTMWSIARRLQPTGDVRALVDRLVAANGSASLQAGDRLVVPA